MSFEHVIKKKNLPGRFFLSVLKLSQNWGNQKPVFLYHTIWRGIPHIHIL